jgi:hypothetical protein
MGADASDGRVEVLKEIRDEIRGVRSELEQLRIARVGASGVRTERVERNARWRMASLVSTGALAVVALVLALRPGPRSASVAPSASVAAPAPVAMAPAATPAPPAPTRTTSAPVTLPPAPIAQLAVAAKPATKLAPRLLASAPAVPVAPPVKKRAKIESPEAAMYAPDEGDTIPFPPPRRVRVHKMLYGPVESEPAKL